MIISVALQNQPYKPAMGTRALAPTIVRAGAFRAYTHGQNACSRAFSRCSIPLYKCNRTAVLLYRRFPRPLSEAFSQITPMFAHQRIHINFASKPPAVHESVKLVWVYLFALSTSQVIYIIVFHISPSLISLCTSSATSITFLKSHPVRVAIARRIASISFAHP